MSGTEPFKKSGTLWIYATKVLIESVLAPSARRTACCVAVDLRVHVGEIRLWSNSAKCIQPCLNELAWIIVKSSFASRASIVLS